MDYIAKINEVSVVSLLPELESYEVSTEELALSDPDTIMNFMHLRKDKYELTNSTIAIGNTEVAFSPGFVPEDTFVSVDVLMINTNRNIRNDSDSGLVGGTSQFASELN